MRTKLNAVIGDAFSRGDEPERHVSADIAADVATLRGQIEELQCECETNLLALVGLINFLNHYDCGDNHFVVSGELATKYVYKAQEFKGDGVKGLVPQVDLPVEYAQLVVDDLAEKDHLIYFVNAVYMAYGLGENAGILPDEEVPFISVDPKALSRRYQGIQGRVLHDVNEIATQINAAMIAQVRGEYGYPDSDESYVAAFVYMMHNFPEQLVYGEAADWLPIALRTVNPNQDMHFEAGTGKLSVITPLLN